MRLKPTLFALALLASAAPQAYAQMAPAAEASAPRQFVSRHTGTFNGVKVKYVATVGETILRNAEGVPTVSFITTSYVREGVKDGAKRPVLFAFNGGPSSASMYLHLGALGPKRMVVPQDVNAPVEKPYGLTDNSYTVLDVADIVLIDPPETGFSRVLPGGKREDFYTSTGDAKAVSQFVEAWLKANGREASPKYVLGESYGTIRAAVMAGELAKTLPLDGVMLMGQAANMIETSQRNRNPISYGTNLTALAAIAAYHGKVDLKGKSLSDFIDEAYAYGMTDYVQALTLGDALPQTERVKVANRLQALTGISADYYLAHRLMISKMEFRQELLKDKGQIMGNYDARYVGPAAQPGQRAADPFDKVSSMVSPLIKDYLKSLGVTLPLDDYRGSAPGTQVWLYVPTGGAGGPFNDYDYPAAIKAAFDANPKFRLVIGTGVYDLTTTIGPARYLVAQSGYPADRVSLKQYDGGHMAYSNEPALKAFTDDIRAFVQGK